MNEDDGHLEGSLEVTQVGEDRGDFGNDIFINGVQADERVEDEEGGMKGFNGPGEEVLIATRIEEQFGGGDDVDIEFGELLGGGV
jgi:hypothetical protein